MSDLDARADRLADAGEAGLQEAITAELEGLDPKALLADLRGSDAWRFVLYEIQGRGCAKPRELAAMALEAMARERWEERETG